MKRKSDGDCDFYQVALLAEIAHKKILPKSNDVAIRDIRTV